MKQATAWNIAVHALRRHFLQGNSLVYNADAYLEDQVVAALEAIRKTAVSKPTRKMVQQGLEAPEPFTPRYVS